MARFAVIGLGKFGGGVTRALYAKGHEVIGIDRDPVTIQEIRDHCTQAIVADRTDQETLKALGPADADAVVFALIAATEVVHPEWDSAVRVAAALGTRILLEY